MFECFLLAVSKCTFSRLLEMELMRPGRQNVKLSAEKSLIVMHKTAIQPQLANYKYH